MICKRSQFSFVVQSSSSSSWPPRNWKLNKLKFPLLCIQLQWFVMQLIPHQVVYLNRIADCNSSFEWPRLPLTGTMDLETWQCSGECSVCLDKQLGKTVQEITKWKPFFSQGKECWQFKCSSNRKWRNGRVWVIIPGKKETVSSFGWLAWV